MEWKEKMKSKVNFIVKTFDAKAGDVTKALKDAGVEVVSVTKVYSEDKEEEKAEGAKK